MKLSNKILIAALSIAMILTFVTMYKIKSIHHDLKQSQTIGNQNWITAEFALNEFTQLQAGNHLEVIWHKGSPMVKVRIEENIKSFFKVKQDESGIKIQLDSLGIYKINGPITVDVYSQTLEKIQLMDFAHFVTKDTLFLKVIKLELEDHSEAEILLQAETMALSMFDFSKLNLLGQVKDASIKLHDHTQLDAEQLDITNAMVDMQDHTDAVIVAGKTLKATCIDHSNLEYLGDSVVAEIVQRDFSKVSKEN